MYLSKISNSTHISFDILSADYNHELVWSFFPGHVRNDRNFHYLVTSDAIYIKSQEKPIDTTNRYIVEIKSHDLWDVEEGEQFEFKILVNPVVRKNGKDHDVVANLKYRLKLEGKAKNHWPSSDELYQQALFEWFGKHEQKHGFAIRSDFEILGKNILPTKNFHIVAYNIVGTLKVTDPNNFVKSMYTGIGHKKDRGCGLLLLKAC